MNKPQTKMLVASWAPAITSEKLSEYEAAIEQVPESLLRTKLLELAAMVSRYIETPHACETAKAKLKSRGGKLCKVPAHTEMDADEIQRIWEETPFAEELPALHQLIETLFAPGANKPLANAAAHLLWYADHLAKDIEPGISDLIEVIEE